MFSRYLSCVRNRTSSARKVRPLQPRKLRVEQVEDRRLMAVFGALDDAIIIDPVFELPRAEGSITFDPLTHRVTIEGTEQHADRVGIGIDTRGTAAVGDDLLLVSLANINSPIYRSYSVFDVTDIIFSGYAGDDFIDNKSRAILRAYAGDGQDTILGGFSDDVLLGGAGDDYIDGRRGDDMIWGEAGMDALFGDDGIDMILGGQDNDWIHGGGGADSLYGEGGDDWLFGGAATDTLTDNVGTNKKFADYSSNTSTILGYYRFDWFDKNLQDPDLRSAIRFAYRDNFLMRDDVLGLFQHVGADNCVMAAEIADLKDLMNKQLTVPVDVRFFIGKIASGDRANGWYQGQVLGNLVAGAHADHLDKLVDKWMKGGDLPAINDPSASYRRVSGQLFVNGATYDDVDQGATSDCYFLAALGEVAQHKNSTIQNMFVDNGDGTFGVRFFKGTSQFWVTVNNFLPVDNGDLGAQFAGWGGGTFTNMANELWVALAEKAYAQLNESGWIEQDGTNSYTGIEFGFSSKAFGHVSSRAGSNRTLSSSLTTKYYLLSDISKGKAIVMATKSSGVDADVVANHAYQLVGFDASTETFELYNPHGANGSRPVRLFFSFGDLVRNCSYWTYVSLA